MFKSSDDLYGALSATVIKALVLYATWQFPPQVAPSNEFSVASVVSLACGVLVVSAISTVRNIMKRDLFARSLLLTLFILCALPAFFLCTLSVAALLGTISAHWHPSILPLIEYFFALEGTTASQLKMGLVLSSAFALPGLAALIHIDVPALKRGPANMPGSQSGPEVFAEPKPLSSNEELLRFLALIALNQLTDPNIQFKTVEGHFEVRSSQRYLAKRLGRSVATVNGILKQLEKEGLISIRGDQRGTTICFVLKHGINGETVFRRP